MFASEDGPYGAAGEPRRGPQAGKSGDPRSQNADNICFNYLAGLFLQAYLNHALVGGVGVFEPEGHGVEAEWPIWGDKCCCGLIGLLHFDLMVSGICIEETQ